MGYENMDAQEYEKITQAYKDRQIKIRNVLLACAASVLIVVIIIISGIVRFFNDPQRAIAKESKALLKQAERLIDDEAYTSAIEVLDQISTDWKDYSRTSEVRASAERGILMDLIGEYVAAGKYEELVMYIDKNVTNYHSDAEISSIYNNAIQECKGSALSKIKAYVEASDFLGAIQYINSLGSSMKKEADIKNAYDSAVANYEAASIVEAEAFVQVGDYTSAKSTLSIAETFIGKTTALTEKLTEINVQELIAQIMPLVEKENYGEAIILLDENATIVSCSTDLQSKLTVYKDEYRQQVIAEAATAYESDGYTSSVSILASALKVLPGDDVLQNLKDKYENAIPVALANLDVIKQGEHFYVGVDSVYDRYYQHALYNREYKAELCKDVNGNSYSSNAIHYGTYIAYDEVDENSRCITYYLNQEYDILTGTLYRPYITLHCDFEWKNLAKVRIYGDGVLLHESSISQSNFDPIKLVVDISGVRELRIEMAGVWTFVYDNCTSYLPKMCLADLEVAVRP